MATIDFSKIDGKGDLNRDWVHGSNKRKGWFNPPIQRHNYNEHTVILRESKDISFEAPFVFLLFGNEKALLIDTGSVKDEKKFRMRITIEAVMYVWLEKNPKEKYDLVIIHTHGHNDHTAGDRQFLGRENTTVVPKDIHSVINFFNITRWPKEITHFDLGGRIVDIIPTPGHDPREITIYDRWTKLLFTGDLIYLGRLYISDYVAFLESLNRLVEFSKNNEISYMFGCHIEMTSTAGKDYPIGARYQPDEPHHEMSVEQLAILRDRAEKINGKSGVHRYDDYIIWIGPCYLQAIKQLIRGFFYNLKRR